MDLDGIYNNKQLVGHSGHIECLIKYEQTKLISGSCDSTIKIWDIKTGE